MTGVSSQAGLATLRAMMTEPVRVFAAVIEWGPPFEDAAPDLILARTRVEQLAEIKRVVRAEYEARHEGGSDWSGELRVLAEAEDAESLNDWDERALWTLQDSSGAPTVSTYTREV